MSESLWICFLFSSYFFSERFFVGCPWNFVGKKYAYFLWEYFTLLSCLMRWKSSILLSILTLFVANFVYFFPSYLVSELILSFSPYILFFALFLLISNSIFFWILNTKSYKKKMFHALMILFLWITVFLYWNLFQSFYKSNLERSKNTLGLKVMFSNIYYKNTHTEDIIQHIEREDPDVIAFVEFSLMHKEKIYDVITQTYPYTNITQWSKTHAGNIVFSKYPLQDLGQYIEQWAWRYNYVTITVHREPYYLYVVHTSAPINQRHFTNRNSQLKKFTQDVIRNSQNSDAHTIIVGDFNVSPWSYYYRSTLATLPLRNISAEYPWLFTWKFPFFPLLRSHIDHIFISDSLQYSQFIPFQLKGSDHKGIIIS